MFGQGLKKSAVRVQFEESGRRQNIRNREAIGTPGGCRVCAWWRPGLQGLRSWE